MAMPPLFGHQATAQQIRDGISEMALDFSSRRDKALATVEEFASRFDPFRALAVLAAYGLSSSVGADGVETKRSPDKVGQDHVELFQALALRRGIGQLSTLVADPSDTQRLWDALIELGHCFDLSRLRPLEPENEADAIVLLQEQIRGRTRAIRNWGYYHQVKDIGRRLLASIDGQLLSNLGFTGSDLVVTLDTLVRRNESRINEHRRKFFSVFRASNADEMISSYVRLMAPPDSDSLAEQMHGLQLNKRQAQAFLLHHSEFDLVSCFTHTSQEISIHSGVEPQYVTSIFAALGVAPGHLSDLDPTKFLLDNPIWTSPWILLPNGSIFACIPQTGLSFLFEIIERLVGPHEQLRRSWHRRRAEFLEEDIAYKFAKALPGARIHRNLEWKLADGDQHGETDLLVLFDSLAIVVEAKSGLISELSKRGAPERLKSQIRDLLEAPSLQSQKFLAAAQAHKSGQISLITSETIDLSKVRRFLRLSITLSDFNTIQSNIGKLQQLGLITKDLVPAPTMCLADLDTVMEILDEPAGFLHYLHRRADLEGKFAHESDELSLLGLYLTNGLLLGRKETDGTLLIFHEMSRAVDRYMTSLSEGILTKKPKRSMTTLWECALDRITATRAYGWSESAVALLDIDDYGQRLVMQGIKKLAKKHRYQKTTPFVNSLTYLPDGSATSAIAAVMLFDDDGTRRDHAAQSIAAHVFRNPRANRCLILGYSAKAPIFPFNFLLLVDRASFVPSDTVGT